MWCAWIGHPSDKLRPFEFLENFHFSISIAFIYPGPQLYIHVKSYGRLNWTRAFVFNFERLDILWAWIGHPSEMLWAFQFLKHYHFLIWSISIYHGPQSYTHVKSYGRLNWTRASLFNFECLDTLCAWIRHPSEMLWPFEFSRTFVFQFRASWYIIVLNHTPMSNVMVVWIRPELLCSMSSVSINYVPESDIQVKSYDHLNFSRTSIFQYQVPLYIMGLNRISMS